MPANEHDDLVARLAAAVLDGEPVDWAAAESGAEGDARSLISHLRAVATLARVHRAARVGTLTEGERLGAYEIVSLLGSGGMGTVYRARDPRLERHVAIKVLHATENDPSARARLWREARAAASVDHPGICRIYDVGEVSSDGTATWPYIVSELLDGESLGTRLAAGPMPPAEVASIGMEILAALDALHGRGIVHSDLKPSNVFLTRHGVKLLDFGLARTPRADRVGEATLSLPWTLIGTPRYMAPERWAGGTFDARVDLFATGALLFEMLTGKPAFTGADLFQICHSIMIGQPPALGGAPAVVAIDRIVHRALEKRPEDRYTTAGAMARDLAGVHAPTVPAAPPVRITTRLIALPFRMLRPDPAVDFLSFSLPDAVTMSLAGLESLVVRSTAAGAKFATDPIDLKTIAAEAGVDAVVWGTLLRAGDQVRVAAQLVAAPEGTILWSKTIQAGLGDLLQLQDQLAHAVVESLAIPLSAREQQQLCRDLPRNARAYEFFLRANQFAYDAAMLSVACELYRSAVEADPDYAPAWARLGRAHRVLAKWGATDADDHRRKAEEAFHHALHLNPDLSLAHNLYTHFELESLGRSKQALVRLLSRAQSHTVDPDLFVGLVSTCRYCGLLDASLAASDHARRLDPAIRTSVMYTHFMSGNWDRAIASDDEDVRWITNYTLPLVGRREAAASAYRELETRPLPLVMRTLMRANRFALEGRRDECVEDCRTVLDLAPRPFDPEGTYFVARTLTHVGETELGLATLADVVSRGFCCVRALRQDPWLAPARTDRRFAEVVSDAEVRVRAAEATYREAGGEDLLGPLGQALSLLP